MKYLTLIVKTSLIALTASVISLNAFACNCKTDNTDTNQTEQQQQNNATQ